MWWYLLVSLMSDSRIRFLLCFVIVAIIIATVLILIEINLKRKNESRLLRLKQMAPLDKIRNFLKSEKSPLEKLAFIDESAKGYFKNTYGTSRNSSYSELIEKFKKKNKRNELAFCESMFEAYYSYEKLGNKQVVSFGNALIAIEETKNKADEISRGPTFADKLDKLFIKIGNVFLAIKNSLEKKKKEKRNKILAKTKVKLPKRIKVSKLSVKKIIPHKKIIPQIPHKKIVVHNKLIKKIVPVVHSNEIHFKNTKKQSIIKEFVDNIISFFGMIKNSESVKGIEGGYARKSIIARQDEQKRRQWIREVISRGYDKNKVSSLLNNWSKTSEDKKNILDMYDEEYTTKIKQQGNIDTSAIHHVDNRNTENKIGIAERIIKNEKERLGKMGIFD